MNQETLIDIQNLQVYFPIRSGLFQRKTGVVKAVDDVSLSIHKGETGRRIRMWKNHHRQSDCAYQSAKRRKDLVSGSGSVNC